MDLDRETGVNTDRVYLYDYEEHEIQKNQNPSQYTREVPLKIPPLFLFLEEVRL